MKGDKGIEQSHLNLQQVEKALLSYQRPHPEFAGTLLGFDDYVNMVLEDVTEFDYSGSNTKLPKILLNGNNICMVTTIYSGVAFRADSEPANTRR